MKSAGFILTVLCAGALFAQQAPTAPPQTQTPGDTETNPVTLAVPYDAAERNYFNFYGFANGLYDSNTYISGANATAGSKESGFGVEGGGGVTGYHVFSTGSLALSYRGGYRAYQSSLYPSGTDQSLSFLFRKQLTRRWSMSFTQSAGFYLYGGTYFSVTPNFANFVQTSPFSPRTRFLGDSLGFTYQASRRIYYEFTGDFYLVRYSNGVAYGDTDFGGSASILYRATRRTTFSGTYSHNYFKFQHNAGSSNVDNAYLTVSRDLPAHWRIGVSGGLSHNSSSGVVNTPVSYLVGTTAITGYVLGSYNQSATLPYYQGTLARTLRHQQFSITGGQSITPGNGFFLASRNLGISGLYSYSWRKANVGAGGYYSRLSSLANAVSSTYSSTAFSGNYGYQLLHYFGLNARYDYVRYSGFSGFTGRYDNRISLGIVISSKNVPMTLF